MKRKEITDMFPRLENRRSYSTIFYSSQNEHVAGVRAETNAGERAAGITL